MNVSLLIAERYLRAGSSTKFGSLFSTVSFLGLVLGVIALIVVVSVMNGFDRELKARILGAVPHVLVQSESTKEVAAAVASMQVVAITPFQEAQLLLVARRGSHLVTVFGISPEKEIGASILPESMIEGRLTELTSGARGIVLGESVARRLGVRIGDKISLVLPDASITGDLIRPRLGSAIVKGIFSVGSELDFHLGVMHVEDLVQQTKKPLVTRLTLDDLFAAPMATRLLREAGYDAEDWTNRYGDFFETVRMEKIMMFILLSFVVAVASFSIVSGLSMLVDSKRRDIAVLRTMGMTESGIRQLFLAQGTLITLIGVSVGALLGIPLAYHVPEVMGFVESLVGFSIVEGTYFDRIPTDPRMLDIAVILVVASLIGFAATLYPSIQAARLAPAEILRYE